MVDKITNPPSQKDLIDKVNELVDDKQDTISDLATIRSGAALGATAVQPNDLATVATSGSYNDLSNKPTIPAAQVNSDWNATSGVAQILNKPTNISAFTNDSGYITSSALTGYATESYVTTAVSGKQDTLVSGTNIKTINNTSILGSGNIDIQGGGNYTAGTGIDITNDVISVTNPLRVEKTDGTYTYFYEIGIDSNNRLYAQRGYDRPGGTITNPIPTSYSFSGTDINISYGSYSGEEAYIKTVSLSIGSNIARKSDIPTKTSDLTNDSGYITNVALNGYATENWVGQQGYITGITSSDVTTALGYTPYNSSNPNGYITSSALTPYVLSSSLATVATSGSYNDLTNKPSLRNIGEIVSSTIPLSDAGLHLLDGALISGSGSYADFVTYIAGLVSTYPDLFETESNWQTSVTNYGVCGKFVYDSENNTVRLPKITGFIEGTTDVTALGDLIEAGLPNITDDLHVHWRDYSGGYTVDPETNTVFYYNGYTAKTSYPNVNGQSSGSYPHDFKVSFDLSRGNPIYGNSNTVQPQSIKVLYYICIATSTKTEIEVDIDEIATDLNGKADVDLSNLNASGKSFASGLSMPSSRYIDLTLGASGSIYTAPANGYFCVAKKSGGTNQYLGLTSYGLDVTVYYDSGMVARNFIPCKKGGTITVNYNMTGDTQFFRFIYAEGEPNV